MVGGAVPDGLTLDPKTGTISGTPSAAGTWYFEAIVTDADNAIGVDGFLTIQINPKTSAAENPVPFLNQPPLPTAAAPGGPALTLNVSGTGFVSGATVRFNDAALKTTFADSEHLSAIRSAARGSQPRDDGASAVVNPASGGGASNVVYFQVGAAETAVSFANAANSPVPAIEPFGLAIADFNQDGKPDLAIAANSQLYTMLGNGDGMFTFAPGSPQRVASPPYDDFGSPYVGPMAVGDFDHSGHLGLAIAQANNDAAVILLGDGSGTFAAVVGCLCARRRVCRRPLHGSGGLQCGWRA